MKKCNIDNKIIESGYEGRYIPEGVLREKGYDVDRIKKNSGPEDMHEDAKLGMCFRIDIKKADYTHQQGAMNSDEYDGTDPARSSPKENIGAEVTKMLSGLSDSTKKVFRIKERIGLIERERIGLIEREKTNLNNLKMEIRLDKVPACMNTNVAFSSLFKELDEIDAHDDNFDDKLAEYRQNSYPMIKVLGQFV